MAQEANQRQVGGSHYRGLKYQHWDLVADSGMGYFEGQLTKYLARWRRKAGKQDLEKSLHYCEKLLELQEKLPAPMRLLQLLLRNYKTLHVVPDRYYEFRNEYELTQAEHEIFILVMTWTKKSELEQVRMRLQHLLEFAD